VGSSKGRGEGEEWVSLVRVLLEEGWRGVEGRIFMDREDLERKEQTCQSVNFVTKRGGTNVKEVIQKKKKEEKGRMTRSEGKSRAAHERGDYHGKAEEDDGCGKGGSSEERIVWVQAEWP